MKITRFGKNWFTIKFEPTRAEQAMAREWLGLTRCPPKLPLYLQRHCNPRRNGQIKKRA